MAIAAAALTVDRHLDFVLNHLVGFFLWMEVLVNGRVKK
jgi:hypothetical protein